MVICQFYDEHLMQKNIICIQIISNGKGYIRLVGLAHIFFSSLPILAREPAAHRKQS